MTTWHSAVSSLARSPPSQWVQVLFVLTAGFLLAICVAPAAERKLLLNYGARRNHNAPAAAKAEDNKAAAAPKTKQQEEDSLVQALRKLTSLGQVPHSFFFTYYAFYILWAEAWAVQYFLDGPNLLGFLTRRQVALAPDAPAMAGSQVVVLWAMMFLQAGRRLYECFAVMKPSKSTMWFTHWFLGLGYYFGVSVAIWVEGSGTSPLF